MVEPTDGTNFSQITMDLHNLVGSLATAVQLGFMSREHASLIWKKWLTLSGLDIPKNQSR